MSGVCACTVSVCPRVSLTLVTQEDTLGARRMGETTQTWNVHSLWVQLCLEAYSLPSLLPLLPLLPTSLSPSLSLFPSPFVSCGVCRLRLQSFSTFMDFVISEYYLLCHSWNQLYRDSFKRRKKQKTLILSLNKRKDLGFDNLILFFVVEIKVQDNSDGGVLIRVLPTVLSPAQDASQCLGKQCLGSGAENTGIRPRLWKWLGVALLSYSFSLSQAGIINKL